jgi:flagellar biogenesis protein FliO
VRLAFVVLWGAQAPGRRAPERADRARGHLPLDARRSIYLVKVGAQVFVVGVGEGGFTKLGEIPAAPCPPWRRAAGVPSPTCSPACSGEQAKKEPP